MELHPCNWLAREKWKFPVIPAALQEMLLLLLVSRLSAYLLLPAANWLEDLPAPSPLLLNLVVPSTFYCV
ncbi:hypothetical protein FQN60_009425 [Etheostoma spectabile]|uniref:Uncharacterized protein n=1 Tax=Etheostoma spectabile TaxID=54343 RepID=A0A5J5DJB8_9PERO|nr:hypothetical protein FQN60_009425 [Etheostoma spectabile]